MKDTTGLTPELAKKIANLIAMTGASFRAIEKIDGMPTKKTLGRWKKKYPEFARMIENAQAVWASKSQAKAFEPPSNERMRHGRIVFETIDRMEDGTPVIQRARDEITCVLDWYKARGIIDDGKHSAGKKLSEIMFYAGKVQRTTIMYGERIPSSGAYDPLVEYSEAQMALNSALKVLKPEEADVLWDVCGADRHAGGAGRIRYMREGLRSLETFFALNSV